MDILEKVDDFYKNYKGEKCIIGKSVNGRNIYSITVRKTDYPKVIVQYAIHGREYITAYLCLKQITDFLANGRRGTVHFVPIANPDGVFISLYKDPLYKANANGVDLNVNFDADWGKGEKNVFSPGAENYVGKTPFSENETRALRDFTLSARPDVTLSYHSKGEEIYFEFGQDGFAYQRDLILAKRISKTTGYPLVSVSGSCGGYKDWCIKTLNIPAFTIEVGSDLLAHPLKEECLDEIYRKNKRVINTLTEFYDK